MSQVDWVAEHARLAAADERGTLGPEDLERLAVAAFLLGLDDDVTALRDRAQQAYLEQGRVGEAARCTFWLGFHLRNRGDRAQAAAWLPRLQRLVAELPPDHPVRGLAQMPMVMERIWAGDPAGGLDDLARLWGLVTRDPDGAVLAAMARGQALVLLGDLDGALASLDEAMLLVSSGDVAPQVVGLAYCAVIDLCMQRLDIARAQEWTTVLSGWCDEQSGLEPYRGTCLVHRAEIFAHHGAWAEAQTQAELAQRLLQQRGHGTVGGAYYQLGELARLRGDHATAGQAYAQAGEHGYETQPGLALLRLAESKPTAAAAGLARALTEGPAPGLRARLLAAQLTACLAGPDADLGVAEAICAALAAEAQRLGTPYAAALAARAEGSVLLERGQAADALRRLRQAWGLWQPLGAAYEAAQTRVLVGRACRALGDEDAARMELAAARSVFEDLGAAPDVVAVDDLIAPAGAGSGGLSPRELEVLRLVATGATNRAIAGTLMLSEKTVARHVSNIFVKLGVASRAAATAYAYENRLA